MNYMGMRNINARYHLDAEHSTINHVKLTMTEAVDGVFAFGREHRIFSLAFLLLGKDTIYSHSSITS